MAIKGGYQLLDLSFANLQNEMALEWSKEMGGTEVHLPLCKQVDNLLTKLVHRSTGYQFEYNPEILKPVYLNVKLVDSIRTTTLPAHIQIDGDGEYYIYTICGSKQYVISIIITKTLDTETGETLYDEISLEVESYTINA